MTAVNIGQAFSTQLGIEIYQWLLSMKMVRKEARAMVRKIGKALDEMLEEIAVEKGWRN